MSFTLDGPLLLAGAGKMGGALLSGLLQRGLDPGNVVVQDPGPPAEVAKLLTDHGIGWTDKVKDLSGPPAVILMAVKPQVMDKVFSAMVPFIGHRTVVLSIAAGRSIASFEKHFLEPVAVVRAMPNTPAAVGRGITVCAANRHVLDHQKAICDALLSSVGEVSWVEDEALLDPVTAVSGSGPAYVFLLTECLAEAGREAGLDAALSQQLARATVSGAGELLHGSEISASALRENVTSPGGTTAAALEVLMGNNGLRELMIKAVAAATRRSRDLAS